mgnify:CR=1 FL=1
MTSQSPMGTMTDQGAEPIVTDEMILADPGKFEGTVNDPFNWPVGGMPLVQALWGDDTRIVPRTFGEWLAKYPEDALLYALAVKGRYRSRFNMARLGPGQLAKLAGNKG